VSVEANDVIPDTKFQSHGKLEKGKSKNVVHYFAALQPDEVSLHRSIYTSSDFCVAPCCVMPHDAVRISSNLVTQRCVTWRDTKNTVCVNRPFVLTVELFTWIDVLTYVLHTSVVAVKSSFIRWAHEAGS
jgi:hypothetical protein